MDELTKRRPVGLYGFEERNDVENGIRLVIPRFRDTPFGRFFSRIAVQKEDKLNLDEFGSFVYKSCDGGKTIGDIAASLREQFGDSIEPLEGRLTLFVQELFKRNLITFVKE